MKLAKIAFSFLLCSAFFLLNPYSLEAGCKQSHMSCDDGPGVHLICGAPYSDFTCYAGGCGTAVIIVECQNPDPQQ